MSTNEPTRPETVPKEAVWNASEGEWELGEKNDQGQYVGEWKWWLAPTGHLVCHTFFSDDGKIESFKRFHPNGEVSQASHDEAGEFVGKIYYRSTDETSELFPVNDPNVWKAVQKPGVPVSFDIFDKDGNQLNNQFEFTKEMLSGFGDLNAYEALERIGSLVEQAAASNESYAYLTGRYKPVFIDTVSQEEVDATEARLGVTLPPSYKQFLVEHGLFKIGANNNAEGRLLPPAKIGRLSDALAAEWQVNWDDYTPEQKALMDNIIYFSMGDESLQLVWYYCIDLNSKNPNTGEAGVLRFTQGDWEWMMKTSSIEDDVTTMHSHVMSLGSGIIKDIKREME